MHKRKMCICLDHKIGTLLHIALHYIAQSNSHINTFGKQSGSEQCGRHTLAKT